MKAKTSNDAREFLIKYFYQKCMKITQKALNLYKMSGVEAEDYTLSFYQILIKSIGGYEKIKGSFETYFIPIFVQKIYSEVDSDFYQNFYLFTSISIDSRVEGPNGLVELSEILTNNPQTNDPRYELNYREKMELLLRDQVHETKRAYRKDVIQRAIYLLRFRGFTNKEIASIMGVSSGVIKSIQSDDSTSTILSRIKKEHL